nr:PAS domain S-box protein [Anaerolineae bacterium]
MDAVRDLKTLNAEELMCYATELEQKVVAFKDSEAEMRQVYNQLETQVNEQTANMEQLNQALAQEVVERIQAEKLLLEERHLLHSLMDNIPDTIYFKDTASRFTRINQAQAHMLGVNHPNDALGKTDADFQVPELAKSFRMEEEAIIAFGQSVVNREEFNPTPDGTPRWLSTTKMPIKDKDGQVTGIVGISRDITERKQVENALRESQDKLQTIFKLLPVGASLIDQDKRLVQMNLALEKIMDMNLDDLMKGKYQSRQY